MSPPAPSPRWIAGRRAGVLGVAAWLSGLPARGLAAQAASAVVAGPQADNATALRAVLQRAHEAASRRNYTGTLVHNAGGAVSASRVQHVAEGGRELERVEALDGEPRAVLRIDGEMRTLLPAQKLVLTEPQDPRASFPALITGGEQRIPDVYELKSLTPERVAGHDADRMLLHARDDLRFDQMIWTDRASGLLLRVDTLAGGHLLESSMFSDVQIGGRPAADLVAATLRQAEGWRTLRLALTPTRLEAEGWQLRHTLPAGFQPLGCVRRGLAQPLANPAAARAPEPLVLQSIFTDGLTHVSVFIEPYQPQRHGAAGLTRSGATHTLTRRLGDDWLTAVGDVPPATLDLFLQSMERRR